MTVDPIFGYAPQLKDVSNKRDLSLYRRKIGAVKAPLAPTIQRKARCRSLAGLGDSGIGVLVLMALLYVGYFGGG